ncbi:hypothetical protein Misp01_39120 [Microtetraspora sp. NBRC 13810]|uniref:hypothetical protein n=1 Tax=Microtetraspora sp. NBRC 13810 TaxID=3030990 RepID=UPI0025524765|nr:hypothetical protein [Microtetraspora sp. NBRC 13810]GLW08782.1 hypothetical protein Misp01_39120 [Microtetraspora sp. NBRC 13810]
MSAELDVNMAETGLARRRMEEHGADYAVAAQGVTAYGIGGPLWGDVSLIPDCATLLSQCGTRLQEVHEHLGRTMADTGARLGASTAGIGQAEAAADTVTLGLNGRVAP